MMSAILSDVLFAAIAGLGFAYVARPPFRTLLISAILAGIGYGFRTILVEVYHLQMMAFATFLTSFLVGCLALLSSKYLKTPSEIISFPALLPMIPGVYAYKTILFLIAFLDNQNENEAARSLYLKNSLEHFYTTLSVTAALAVGASSALLLFVEQSFKLTRYSNKLFKKFK